MKRLMYNQNGNIAMMSVFFIMMMLVIFAFADQAIALKESGIAIRAAGSEKAYYAAQGCVEEAYLQLRSDASFAGNTINTAAIHCNSNVSFNGTTDGTVTVLGTYRTIQRSIISEFEGAGPTATSNTKAIYHIIDRSGSMDDDTCINRPPTFNPPSLTQATCEAAGYTWQLPLEPISTAKAAAIRFIDNLNSSIDRIGVVHFSSSATLHYLASHNFAAAKNAVTTIPNPGGDTNIGDAIAAATAALIPLGHSVDDRIEILLTDGRATRPTSESVARSYALDKAADAKNEGITVITIGLGSDVDPDLLRNMASEIDDVPLYFYADEASDLDAVYSNILNVITTYEIQQTAWEEQ